MVDIEAPSELVQRLHSLRVGRGLTINQMADQCGLPKSSLESYMRMSGAKRPGIDALASIASGLGVSLDWLVFGSEVAGADANRLVRLSAQAAALAVFRGLLTLHRDGKTIEISDETILHLTPEEWAAEIAFDAGERAKNIATAGTSRENLIVAERVFQRALVERVTERLNAPVAPQSDAHVQAKKTNETA